MADIKNRYTVNISETSQQTYRRTVYVLSNHMEVKAYGD
jgi:hypothetical protein